MEAHQLINQSSGDVEIYSPPEVLDPVRQFLGGQIDLDPASSLQANERVRAWRVFTAPAFTIVGAIRGLLLRRYADRGGLDRPWFGNVWMNPPFSQPENACAPNCAKQRCKDRGWHTATDLPGTGDWVEKICDEYLIGHVTAACCITFAATSETWFQPLLQRPVCFPRKRTNYLLPDGTVYKGVTKGSAITCFGDVRSFARAFRHLGEIKINYP